ncbi:MAG: flagellar basal-body MS-ring/collar protein FliF [Acidobacteriaceae bacterium]
MAETGKQQLSGLERSGQQMPLSAVELTRRARQIMEKLREHLAAMPARQRMWVLGSGLMVAGVAAGLLWLTMRPDWRVLYTGLEAKDAQQIGAELTQAGIAYDLTPDGASIRVPASELDKARMQVAAKGIPQTGRMGFEIFDKPNWVGSEFDEKVNYQRALEGELEHTIETLGSVRSARVHLVMPDQSLFASEQREAKASVVLKLRRASLSDEEADSIRNLVAGAVDTLRPDNVVLVDADGRVNFASKSASAEAAAQEQALQEKVIALLAPLAGRDNIRATVNLSYDQGTDEQTEEVYDPSNVATLSMRRSEQTSDPQLRPVGVPGTASNTPAAAAQGSVQGAVQNGTQINRNPVPPLMQTAPPRAASTTSAASVTTPNPNLPLYPQITGQGQNSREESADYAVSQRTHHSLEGPGRIRRVTAAILINDRAILQGTGKQAHLVWEPRTQQEMNELEQLAQAAVGYDARRGDEVVLENVAFSSNTAQATPALERLLRGAGELTDAQAGMLRFLLLGVALLVLLFFILRPAVKQISNAFQQPVLLAAPSPGRADAVSLVADATPIPLRTSLAQEMPAALAQARSPQYAQAIFDHVSDYIRREPEQSKRLLESWIHGTEESK